MAERRTITLLDFLTPDEVRAASKLFDKCRKHNRTFAAECEREIIQPQMERINAALGQENNARYLAYAVEAVLNQVKYKRP